ncbi:hypothetical protein [Nitrobacter sp. TKz-YC02]|uniref:hypothetical protein n=1 Tax=Nitrobacter sp. TKz-YC02 TaxID=3398704 RepID=UPI003CF0D102
MTIYEHPSDARRRLAELGISVEAVIRALQAGQLARLSCTPNDPPFIPGTEAWRFVVRTLREELLSKGYRKSDPNNFSLIINDARKLNICVASADTLTRSTSGDPKTKHLKGLFLEAATIRNRHTGGLFPEDIPEEVRVAISVLEYPTWMLLIYITDDEIRAELSYPDKIEDGQIVSWKERIFIPDSADDSGGMRNPLVDSEPDIDVPVRRKAS